MDEINLQDLILPSGIDLYESAWHLFVIRHPKRNQLISYLKEQGIETLIHYPIAPHQQEIYKGDYQIFLNIRSLFVLNFFYQLIKY